MMPETNKDPGIKLFGMTIQLPDTPAPAPAEMDVDPAGTSSPPFDPPGDDCSAKDSSCSETDSVSGRDDDQLQKNECEEKLDESEEEEGSVLLKEEEIMDLTGDEMRDDDSKDPTEISKAEEEEGKISDAKDKTLKKPDKIIPCPRCESMDTKFCYFNNYNVNQPRHFCKKCQRYWTSGGATRNLPVGAGRRKSKISASHYHHLDAVTAFQNLDGIQHHSLKANGKVLTLASELNIPIINNIPNTEQGIPVSYGDNDNGADHSSASSATAAASTKDEVGDNGNRQNYPCFNPQLPCFPCPPWPYPSNAVQWNSTVPSPGCFSPGFPMPFYPASPYWGYTVPFYPAPQQHTASRPNSQTLGKHSRDDNKDNNPERCLWAPKTLRFDDPEDAAKSSIWATLGIKHDSVDSIRGGAFKAFKLKDDEMTHASKHCRVLEANPAALSRSLYFHESS